MATSADAAGPAQITTGNASDDGRTSTETTTSREEGAGFGMFAALGGLASVLAYLLFGDK